LCRDWTRKIIAENSINAPTISGRMLASYPIFVDMFVTLILVMFCDMLTVLPDESTGADMLTLLKMTYNPKIPPHTNKKRIASPPMFMLYLPFPIVP
jgi:hypothetical protein